METARQLTLPLNFEGKRKATSNTGRTKDLQAIVRDLIASLNQIEDEHKKIEAINSIKLKLHENSPLKNNPVDCVLWVKTDQVEANDYNPNKVAPPEMELLKTSILHDGYTQPIVSWPKNLKTGTKEVVDGFHRTRVAKEYSSIKKMTKGYVPVVTIRESQEEKGDRVASTIRHNRARGKHQIDAMSEIVVELKNRNWTNERICKELGMDMDEVLRLCQITGLASLFADQEFSKAWDIEGEVTESDLEELNDNIDEYEQDVIDDTRVVNVNDSERIFHTYDKWECVQAGIHKKVVEGKTKDQCQEEYRAFLSNLDAFEKALQGVTSEWKHSCEHYLTNKAMNRIAWLGQAAACYAIGIPAEFRGGFNLLTEDQQQAANELALKYLNKWLASYNMAEVTMEEAMSSGRQMEIY
jgi:ParB-like chromosome segregation protein Spo0J